MTFGENLRIARMKKGISQKELAERVGVFPSAISRYENGNHSPCAKNVHRFAEALEIPILELLQ